MSFCKSDQERLLKTDKITSLANPLSHLSANEIEKLYQRYLEGERTSALIAEFEIHTDSNSILKLLPAIERNDLVCPHCGSNAIQRRAARLGLPPHPQCKKCDHLYVSKGQFCGCGSCGKAYVRDLNGAGNNIRVPYTTLTSREKMLLMGVLMLANEWDTTSFLIDQRRRQQQKLAPTIEAQNKYVRELFQRRIIIVSQSTLSQHINVTYESGSLEYLQWVPNISLASGSDDALSIDSLKAVLSNELIGKRHSIGSDLYQLMYEIAIEELIEYLINQIASTRLVFNALEVTREAFDTLLETKSVSDIFGFIRKGVRQADQVLGTESLRVTPQAGDLVPMKIWHAAEYFESRPHHYQHKSFPRMKRLRICRLSEVIYDLILKDPDGAFKTPLPQYIKSVMSSKQDR